MFKTNQSGVIYVSILNDYIISSLGLKDKI